MVNFTAAGIDECLAAVTIIELHCELGFSVLLICMQNYEKKKTYLKELFMKFICEKWSNKHLIITLYIKLPFAMCQACEYSNGYII